MWLTRFETCICEDALKHVQSEDDAGILAGMLMKLTDWHGLKRYQLAEPALRALIWCESERTKQPSFVSIINTIERLHLHREDRRDGLTAYDLGKFERDFEWLLQNPAWINFIGQGSDNLVREAVDSLASRLRSFMPDVTLPVSLEEQLARNGELKV